MYSKTFDVSENPRITVDECAGNLNVKIGETNLVTVTLPDDEDIHMFDQDGDVINMTLADSCTITVPPNSTLNLKNVNGNLKVRNLTGDLKIGEVNGNTNLRDVGALVMDTGHGNLRIKSSAGAVEINQVAGNARVENVNGPFKLGSLGASLRAQGLLQGMAVETVGADARLGPPFTPGEKYTLNISSDLAISLPDAPNLAVNITAGGQVHSNVTGLELSEDGGTYTGTIGDGEAVLDATVGGSVVFLSSVESVQSGSEDFNFDFDFDPEALAFLEDLGPMIEETVNKAMSQVDVHLQEGLKYLDSDEFRAKMDKVAEKARHAAERVERQAEGVAERARRSAERAAERARMRAQQSERKWQRASGQRSTPTTTTESSSVEDKREERMKILRMVEEGKITSDEAAKLLTALS
jgi:hypothetical protein